MKMLSKEFGGAVAATSLFLMPSAGGDGSDGFARLTIIRN